MNCVYCGTELNLDERVESKVFDNGSYVLCPQCNCVHLYDEETKEIDDLSTYEGTDMQDEIIKDYSEAILNRFADQYKQAVAEQLDAVETDEAEDGEILIGDEEVDETEEGMVEVSKEEYKEMVDNLVDAWKESALESVEDAMKEQPELFVGKKSPVEQLTEQAEAPAEDEEEHECTCGNECKGDCHCHEESQERFIPKDIEHQISADFGEWLIISEDFGDKDLQVYTGSKQGLNEFIAENHFHSAPRIYKLTEQKVESIYRVL